MLESIDTAYAALNSALPHEWVMSSVVLRADLRFNVTAMSHGDVDPAVPWMVVGTGDTIASAMADASVKLRELATQ